MRESDLTVRDVDLHQFSGADAFFASARERYRILLRRRAGFPRPWTNDPIFDQYKFTNVFREDDKTTVWLRENVRKKMYKHSGLLLATVVFRMFNRIETGEAMFLQGMLSGGGTAFEEFLDKGDTRPLKRAILSYCGRGPYTTGAYIISSPPGMNKLDGVLQTLRTFHRGKSAFNDGGAIGWDQMAEILHSNDDGAVGMQDVFRWLEGFPYFGSFHSYEIVCDLRYTHMLEAAPDRMTWANLGPGAKRGLNYIHDRRRDKEGRSAWGQSIPEDEAISEMQDLLRKSKMNKFWPKEWPSWEMREVEMWLCEESKRMRVQNGEGRPRGVYR